MFTLITDRNLRNKLSSGEYLRRLNIMSSFGELSIIIRDDHVESDQKKSLKEIREMSRNKDLRKCKIILSTNIQKFNALNDKSMIDTIHMKYIDYKKSKLEDIEKIRNKGIDVATSVHSISEYDEICIKNPNYILLSPLFLTKCKVQAKSLDDRTLDYIIYKADEASIKRVALGGIGYTEILDDKSIDRYKRFSNFAIRSFFYESLDLRRDLERVVEVSKNGY